MLVCFLLDFSAPQGTHGLWAVALWAARAHKVRLPWVGPRVWPCCRWTTDQTSLAVYMVMQ